MGRVEAVNTVIDRMVPGPGVYLIQPEGEAVVKIGFASVIRDRLLALQTGSHRRLILLADSRPWGTPRCERELHARFQQHRVRGEWFALSHELAAIVFDEFGLRNPTPEFWNALEAE